jgi:hypothetical protein
VKTFQAVLSNPNSLYSYGDRGEGWSPHGLGARALLPVQTELGNSHLRLGIEFCFPSSSFISFNITDHRTIASLSSFPYQDKTHIAFMSNV